MTALANALVYAVTYINLRDSEQIDKAEDARALESIAAMLALATSEEKDALAAAAQLAFDDERSGPAREEFLGDYAIWMEDVFGDDWAGNERAP
ncbi:MAG: hypothetical protein ACKVP0_14910 [Pirellulaceae bacterium]